jgi:hypothetical protein
MEACSPRPETGVDCPIHGPEKFFELRERFSRRDGDWERRVSGRNHFHGKPAGRPGNEYPLPDLDLTGVFDSVDARQLFVANVVRLADTKQILPGSDGVIDALKSLRLRSRRLRSATEDRKKNEKGNRSKERLAPIPANRIFPIT